MILFLSDSNLRTLEKNLVKSERHSNTVKCCLQALGLYSFVKRFGCTCKRERLASSEGGAYERNKIKQSK